MNPINNDYWVPFPTFSYIFRYFPTMFYLFLHVSSLSLPCSHLFLPVPTISYTLFLQISTFAICLLPFHTFLHTLLHTCSYLFLPCPTFSDSFSSPLRWWFCFFFLLPPSFPSSSSFLPPPRACLSHTRFNTCTLCVCVSYGFASHSRFLRCRPALGALSCPGRLGVKQTHKKQQRFFARGRGQGCKPTKYCPNL